MSLYHVDFKRYVEAKRIEQNIYVRLLLDRKDPRTVKKILRIFDEQIADTSPAASSALTFAMLATLVGHNSICPTGDANYVWDKVMDAATQHPKTAHYILGMLAQWRFAVDDREWLCARKDSGKTNEDGEDIYVTVYWVKPPHINLRPPVHTMADLKAKFHEPRA